MRKLGPIRGRSSGRVSPEVQRARDLLREQGEQPAWAVLPGEAWPDLQERLAGTQLGLLVFAGCLGLAGLLASGNSFGPFLLVGGFALFTVAPVLVSEAIQRRPALSGLGRLRGRVHGNSGEVGGSPFGLCWIEGSSSPEGTEFRVWFEQNYDLTRPEVSLSTHGRRPPLPPPLRPGEEPEELPPGRPLEGLEETLLLCPDPGVRGIRGTVSGIRRWHWVWRGRVPPGVGPPESRWLEIRISPPEGARLFPLQLRNLVIGVPLGGAPPSEVGSGRGVRGLRTLRKRSAPGLLPSPSLGPGPSPSDQGPVCQICGELLRAQEPSRDCPECGTPHHRDCWDFAGGCSTYGCKAARSASRRR